MQLKIQRSQRMGGALGNTAVFCLDAQADYSPSEVANIAKYKLGRQVIYNSRASKQHLERAKAGTQLGGFWGYAGTAASLVMAKLALNISVESLGRGQHIECKDMLELLEAEEEVMDACRMLKRFLAAAATFNGSIALIDFDEDEKLHVGQGALAFAGQPPGMGEGSGGDMKYLPGPARDEYESWVDQLEALVATPAAKVAAIGAGIVLLVLLLAKYA